MAQRKSTPAKSKAHDKTTTRKPKKFQVQVPKLASLEGVWAIDAALRELTWLRQFVLTSHGNIIPAERVNSMRIITTCAKSFVDCVQNMVDRSEPTSKKASVPS